MRLISRGCDLDKHEILLYTKLVLIRKQKVTSRAFILIAVALFFAFILFANNARDAHAVVVPIVFPVLGSSSYSNDFNAPRASGTHHATDIFANKRQGVVAAADGMVTYVPYPEPSWGYMIRIEGNDGYTYNYIHLNNDRPGTDDGKGGGMLAYAPDMERWNPVKKGQLIGWVGDSGNAENTPPHLHFEIYRGDTPINPFDSLNRATRISRPVTNYPQLPHEYLPYGQTTRLKANVAMGNLDSNPLSQETVIGAGYGGGPHVKVAGENNQTVGSFFAYDKGFRGGVEVDVGDIDGDGIDEIVAGAGPGGGPHVKIFDLDGRTKHSFMAYDTNSRFGVRASVGDVNGDGLIEIITAPLIGHKAPVKVFDLSGNELSRFFAYGNNHSNGHDLAVGDVNGDGADEIITSPGKGSGPHVRVFNSTGTVLGSFFVYNEENRGGVRVSVDDVFEGTASEEIVTVPQTYGGPHVKVVDQSGRWLGSNMFLEEWWRGGYDIAAGKGAASASAGELRRTTIRSAL